MSDITLAVNLREIFTALISKGTMRYYDRTYTMPIPPNSTVEIVRLIEAGKVSLVSEEMYVVDTDHALKIETYIDGELRGYNDDVVQQTYSIPVNWMNLGAFTPIYESLLVRITNKTSNLVNITVTSRYGVLPRHIYDRIIDKYASMVIEFAEVVTWKESAKIAGQK